ncbi:TetR/AcrR family transcriptional regulator [Glycomyces harbinensis]|uniref:Transcriptional regulator, TetR family n=1 Tax=Glycomyces harbinensis TaxID=58114 RepID=A0A1G6T2V6_9ACTN|nr:TetR family transcriptional regulator [Glycomyces harbinensis]SDD23510.1 transcriptional regulator, TetR family [Glycomyces harbinensis]
MVKTARRTRAEMLDRTREQLIAAGREHFGSHGYAATSMDDLTGSVGLTRGALYHHFGGKSGLLEAVVRRLDDELCVQLKAILRGNDDPLDALAERGRAYIEKTQTPEFQRIMFTDAPAVLPDAIEETAAACIATLAEVVQEGRARGIVAADVTPVVLATMLNGALADASRWVAAAPEDERESRLEAARRSSTALVQGLRTAT